MISRQELGGWLDGPSRAPGSAGDYPGQRLGYPRSGAGSIARFGPRAGALAIDWALSLLIATGTTGYRLGTGGASSFAPLVVFAVMSIVLVGTAGCTIGHRLVGLRVVLVSGGYAGPLPAAIRTVALCLAVPALIWDRDQRGLHDKIAGTSLIKAR